MDEPQTKVHELVPRIRRFLKGSRLKSVKSETDYLRLKVKVAASVIYNYLKLLGKERSPWMERLFIGSRLYRRLKERVLSSFNITGVPVIDFLNRFDPQFKSNGYSPRFHREARALSDFLRLALVDSENNHQIAVNILAASDVRLDGAKESRKIEIARLNLELIGSKQCTDVRSYLSLNTPKNYLIDEMDLLYLKSLTEKLSHLKAV